MVQMKITASVLIAAAAIAPAVAYGFEAEDSLVTRDDNEFASAYGRGLDLDLNEREFDEELYEREPFRGMGAVRGAVRKFRGGSRHRQGGSAPSTPTESERREFNEELYEREPFRGMGAVRGAVRKFRGGSRHRQGGSAPSTPTESQSERREFDDDLLEREFDEELYQREPLRAQDLPNIVRGSRRTSGGGNGRRQRGTALERREFDEELYEREPFRGMGAVRGAVRKFRGGSRHRQGGSAPSTPTESQSERREFDDDLLEREFDEELYEREPFRGMGAVRGAVRKFRGGSRHRQGGSAPSTPTESQSERREFDEELYEREPFRGMGAVRGAVRKFRGGSRHRQGGSAPSTPTESQSERREFDDKLMEREFDDELFGREYDSELFEREPLFGFIKKWFNKKKAPAPAAEAAPAEARDFDELD